MYPRLGKLYFLLWGLEAGGVAVVVAGVALGDLGCEFEDRHTGTEVDVVDSLHQMGAMTFLCYLFFRVKQRWHHRLHRHDLAQPDSGAFECHTRQENTVEELDGSLTDHHGIAGGDIETDAALGACHAALGVKPVCLEHYTQYLTFPSHLTQLLATI